MMLINIIICTIVLNLNHLFETAGGSATCKEEISENTIEVLFNKNGTILYLDEWNNAESNEKFKLVMAEQATIFCSNDVHECSLINYNATTHPFEAEHVGFTGSTPSFANGYIKIEFYIKLTGQPVYPGAETIYVIRKSALKSMTVESVNDLNSTLGFTTSFIDGELIAGGVDYSLDKIIIPITFVVFLILSIVAYAHVKAHDDIEEMKRRSGYGSRTRVSPGIEHNKVYTQHEGENNHTQPNEGDNQTRDTDIDQMVHGQLSADSSDFCGDDIGSSDFNPESKYNNTAYGHHGHVPRIGLPHGPTPYAYPRRSFKVKDEDEETPPPGYAESQQNMPAQELAVQEQPVQQPPALEPSAKEPSLAVMPPPAPANRLPPLVPKNPHAVEGSPLNNFNGTHQPIKAAPVILDKEVEKDANPPATEHQQKPDEVTPNGDKTEDICQPVAKDTLPTNSGPVVGVQENASKYPDNEVTKAPKKKHKKHKRKHKNEQDGQERSGEDETQQKRKKHRKKKKKHRHRHSDDDDDDGDHR